MGDDYTEWLMGKASDTISKYIINVVSRFMRNCAVKNMVVTFNDSNITAFHIMSLPKHVKHFGNVRGIIIEPDATTNTIKFSRNYALKSVGSCEFEFSVIQNQLNENTVSKIKRKSQCYTNLNS